MSVSAALTESGVSIGGTGATHHVPSDGWRFVNPSYGLLTFGKKSMAIILKCLPA
jgi:hypothetical protein